MAASGAALTVNRILANAHAKRDVILKIAVKINQPDEVALPRRKL